MLSVYGVIKKKKTEYFKRIKLYVDQSKFLD